MQKYLIPKLHSFTYETRRNKTNFRLELTLETQQKLFYKNTHTYERIKAPRPSQLPLIPRKQKY